MNVEIIKCKNGWLLMRTYPHKIEFDSFVFLSLHAMAEWITNELKDKMISALRPQSLLESSLCFSLHAG